METFVTADTHFDHESILQYCNRPFDSIEDMNDALIERWNGRVGRRDKVYVVGDFAFKRHLRWLNALHGKKVLIRGNHDDASQKVYTSFTEVHDLLTRRIGEKQVVFCHYALRTWPDNNQGAWHLYGHSHGRLTESPARRSCDVGVDVWGYAPVPWEALARKLEARAPETPDENDSRGESEANVKALREENLTHLRGEAPDA